MRAIDAFTKVDLFPSKTEGTDRMFWRSDKTGSEQLRDILAKGMDRPETDLNYALMLIIG